ncbi:hypothetical protein RB598_005108 [Gaeumannomyces tritici]
MPAQIPTSSIIGAGVTKNKGPRACTTCARAKSRCRPGPVPSACERCHRLEKPCSSQTPAPPRKRKETRPNRMAELERRLQDLTSKLQPVVDARQQQQQQQQQHHGDQQLSPPVSTPDTTEDQLPVPATSKRATSISSGGLLHLLPGIGITVDSAVESDYGSTSSASSPGRGRSSASAHTPVPPSSGPTPAPAPGEKSVWLNPTEAAFLLREYHEHMQHLFPFVVVPAHVSSDELRRQRPFLWKAVMTEACHMDGRRQTAMGHQVLTEMAAATITASASAQTLDLLQGIQLLLAWFNFGMTSFQITNLLFLARSLCFSLGLGEPQGSGGGPLTSARLEEMRAYACTYYLVTLTFTSNKKPDALMGTSHIDACCEAIQSRMEHPTDQLLLQLVRVQQLIQSIHLALVPFAQSAHARGNTTTLPPGTPPLGVVVRDFQRRIAEFEQSVPEDLTDHPGLRSHIIVAHIQLYEISLNELPRPPPPPPPPLPDRPGFDTTALAHQVAAAAAAADEPEERLELLWLCLDACRRYMAFRFSGGGVPPARNPRPHAVCLSASLDFVVAMITSLKLWMLQAPPPGWDRASARKGLNLEVMADHMIEELREAVLDRQCTIAGYFSGGEGGGGGGGRQVPQDDDGGGGPLDLFETLRQRMVFIRTALLSEARDSARDAQATAASARAGPSVGGGASDATTTAARCAYEGQGQQDQSTGQRLEQDRQVLQQDEQQQQQQQQQQQEQLELLPPHVPMADLDLDSWAANLFIGEEDWDPSTMMVFDWST